MNFDYLMDLFLAGCGLYFAYSAYETKKSGILKPGILVSKNIVMRRDADKAGYINFVCPLSMIAGILTFFCGCVGLVNDYYGGLSMVYIIMIGVFLIGIICYSIVVVKAQKKYLL